MRTQFGVGGRADWLRWLTRIRFFGISLVLALELLVAYRDATNARALVPFLALVALWYVVALFERVLLGRWRALGPQIYLQLSLDMLLITALIAVSGGVNSLLTEIYALLVIVAALLLPGLFVYVLAGVCAVSYWAAAELALQPVFAQLQPTPAAASEKALALSVLLNGLAFLAAAYLAELLAGKLKAAGEELEDQQYDLASLRALNDNIVRSMSGGLLTTDLAGRIYLANASAERILERGAGELVGEQVEAVFGEIPETMLGRRGEVSLSIHGQDKVIGLTVVLLRVSGGTAGRVFHFQDLTELRRLERELRVRDRMTALGRMAAGIAHEIRNPLASLAGSVQLLARYASLDDEQQKLIAIVERESERLNRIIGDFLGYARDHRYQMTPLDLRAVLEDVLALARNGPRCQGGGIAIEADLGRAPILVRGDADRLKQVFWNLSDNALKAMPQQGKLRVTARPSSLGVRLEFQDTGCGLKAGSEEEIFEPFRSHFGEGTGLGLSTVYALIEAHQGFIWAERPEEGGTRFVIQLPLDRPVTEEEGELATAGGGDVRLLRPFQPSAH